MKLLCRLFLLISCIELIECQLEEEPTTSPSDIKLYYYNKLNIEEPLVEVCLDDVSNLYENFNSGQETVLTVHGWYNGHNSQFSNSIKNAILYNYDVNFIEVVWPSYAEYTFITNILLDYGEYIGQFLNDLCIRFNYSHSNVKLIGHNLGAHLCGIAGSKTSKKIKSIVGLDPSGIIFNKETDECKQLFKGQAEYVEVIHTTADTTGLMKSVGDSDFWPNGGNCQPGCDIISDLNGCSNDKSWKYYAKSISNPYEFVALKYNLSNSFCYVSKKVYMGGFDLDTRAIGDYYLKTSSDEPYALGTSWIK